MSITLEELNQRMADHPDVVAFQKRPPDAPSRLGISEASHERIDEYLQILARVRQEILNAEGGLAP